MTPRCWCGPEALISIGDHAFNDLMPISAIGGQTLWIDPYPGIHEPEYTWCVHTLGGACRIPGHHFLSSERHPTFR